MKKIILGVLAVTVLLLSVSCGKGTAVIPKTTGISFVADMEFFENKCVASVNVKENGDTKAEIISPDSIKGLSFIFSGGDATVRYLGLEYKYDMAAQPSGAAVSYLYEMLKDASCDGRQISFDDGRFYTDGRISKTKYRMYFGATGLPISACDGENNFKISFKNAAITDGM